MVLTLCLTGCGGGGGKRVVNVCGWGENIDEDLIRQFEEETGIHVNYQTAESNETMYSLIKQGGADYDVIVPSDYMISQLMEEGMLEELERANVLDCIECGACTYICPGRLHLVQSFRAGKQKINNARAAAKAAAEKAEKKEAKA